AMVLEGFARQLARNSAWHGRDGDRVNLTLDAKARHLLNDERRAAIEQALSAQLASQRDAERQQDAESVIFADPVVRAFREQFGATIKPGSIHPLDS
ncbi:MAG TPA: DNA polymerase III subunit gamma/tau C-terminal domain-containing protein, partial [Solimonas sp.]|nr:DNA polymerase III subunit gamma/tau C-terminal domain-containing protein [Solimonas sp.]